MRWHRFGLSYVLYAFAFLALSGVRHAYFNSAIFLCAASVLAAVCLYMLSTGGYWRIVTLGAVLGYLASLISFGVVWKFERLVAATPAASIDHLGVDALWGIVVFPVFSYTTLLVPACACVAKAVCNGVRHRR